MRCDARIAGRLLLVCPQLGWPMIYLGALADTCAPSVTANKVSIPITNMLMNNTEVNEKFC